MKKYIPIWLVLLLFGLYLGIGCAPQPPIHQPDGGGRIITLDLDPRDYAEVAKQLTDSMATNSRLNDKVIVLGPVVNDLDRSIRFDKVTLQEKIQEIELNRGQLQFQFAIDAMKGNDVCAERFKIMQLQFEKEDTIDPEDLLTFGSLADVDYILFGRVTSQTTKKWPQEEITYVFNWKLGDCRTGLLAWAKEIVITKSTR